MGRLRSEHSALTNLLLRMRAFAGVRSASSAAQMKHLTKVTQDQLHVSRPTWWLESRFHFSFADWRGGSQSFGALRVLNDDLVKGKAGFGRHPHRDAEIYSYVVDGRLSHQDSMGNKESLGRGAVQYLSAGTGISHSEMNDGTATCRFLQVWLTPDRRGHAPQYGSATFEPAERHNKLLVLLGGTGRVPDWPNLQQGRDIVLHQDATVFVSENDAGVQHSLALGARRQAYLVCIGGGLDVVAAGSEAVQLDAREAVRIRAGGGELPLALTAGAAGAHFMLIEMAQA